METTQLALGLQVEQVQALFLSAKELKRPTYTLYRVDGGDTRWYYREDTDRYYPSVTSVISATTPTPYGLIEWMKRHGENADAVRDEAAAYGTWMHIQFADLLINREYDVSALEPSLIMAAAEAGVRISETDWLTKAKQDLLSFAQFVRDHSVEPIAIEACLTSEGGFAGAVDLLCRMRVGTGRSGAFLKKDGEGQEITAIIDFKSGRKGFYESHEIQLHMYRLLVQENFGIAPDKLYNWSPKDWRTKPTYTLKDQTESRHAAKIPHLLTLFQMDGKTGPSDTLVLDGKISIDTPLESVYRFEGMRERIKQGA